MEVRTIPATGLFWAVLFCALLPCQLSGQSTTTPQNFKIAFIGDQGLGSDPQAVLTLILDEGTDAVLHQGDFDYQDDPQAWDDQIYPPVITSFSPQVGPL